MKTHVFQGDQLVPACLKQLRICSLALVPVGVAGNFHNVTTEDGYAPFHLQLKIPYCLNLPEREPCSAVLLGMAAEQTAKQSCPCLSNGNVCVLLATQQLMK